MLSFNSNSLVKVHAQKIRVGIFIAIAAALVALVGAVVPGRNASLAGNVAALVALITLLWLGYAVTCPRCNLRLLSHAISKQSVGSWFSWTLSISECPRCGHRNKETL